MAKWKIRFELIIDEEITPKNHLSLNGLRAFFLSKFRLCDWIKEIRPISFELLEKE